MLEVAQKYLQLKSGEYYKCFGKVDKVVSVIPIIRLDKMLDIEPKEQEPDHLTVVIVQKGDQQAGLVVDNLIGQQEIVIKSLGKYINGNKLISGATILGDGDVALILDVNTLM